MRTDVPGFGRGVQWRLDSINGWWHADGSNDLSSVTVAGQELAFGPETLSAHAAVTEGALQPIDDPHSVGHMLAGLPVLAPDRSAVSFLDPETVLSTAPSLVPADPLYAQQWHLNWIGRLGSTGFIGLERIWDEYRGQGVRVGVWDDGVQSTHWDLDGNYNATRHVVVAGVGTNNGQPIGSGDAHGTNVAGLIAAERNGLGGVGVAYQAQVTGVTVFSGLFGIGSQNSNYLATLANGLTNFDVTNHSYGKNNALFLFASTPSARLAHFDTSVDNGRGGLGTINLNSAGNNNANANGEDWSGSRFTITVAASDFFIDQTGRVASYSNHGANILVAAPAGGITTDLLGADGYTPGDYTFNFNGTSAATPVTAGVVSLMLSANPGLGWRDVQNILAASAVGAGSFVNGVTTNEDFAWRWNGATNWNGGGAHISEDYGYGMVNAFQAVRMAEAWLLFGAAKTSANEASVTSGNLVTNLVIADPTEASFNFDVSGALEIEHVSLTVTLQHSRFTDINLFLVSPSGTRVMLLNGSAGNVSTSDAAWTYTFGVDLLRGELAAGNWQVRWSDGALGEVGTITAVNLTAYGRTDTANDVYHYTDEAIVALTRQPGRLVLNDTDGGTDWINASAMWRDVVLDLRTGTTSTLAGATIFQMGAGVIENAHSGDGNDWLIGNAAANQLYGGRGNDLLEGGAGADRLDGGAGFDFARYEFSAAAVTVRLDTGLGSGGDAEGDTLFSIEGLVGSAWGDTLVGSNLLGDWLYGLGGDDYIYGLGGVDWLFGLAGSDFLYGGHGNDMLEGGAGGDRLDGGELWDYARYDASSAGVTVRLDTGLGSGGDAEGDTLFSIEGLVGSAWGDTLVGSNGGNFLDGLGGNDWIYGLEAPDVLFGGDGNDMLEGGAGNDRLFGGEGFDFARYEFSAAGVTVRLDTGLGSWGDAQGDTLFSIEGLVGSAWGDTLVGSNVPGDYLYGLGGNDWIYGLGGSDFLFGGNGTDMLEGGAGGDWLDGGEGFDFARYDSSSAGVILRLDYDIFLGGDAEGDGFVSIEGLVGSSLVDFLIGSNVGGGDILFGLAGDDWLFGQAEADQLYGGDGSDQLIGGSGADYLSGGAGNDQFWTLLADFEAGVWDIITDFGESGVNFDYLRFEGFTPGQLIVADNAGNCVITTTWLNFSGGIIIQNFSGAQMMDQLIFS